MSIAEVYDTPVAEKPLVPTTLPRAPDNLSTLAHPTLFVPRRLQRLR